MRESGQFSSILEFQDSTNVLEYLLWSCSSYSLHELIVQLLQTLSIFSCDNLQNQSFKGERLKQYLRKFAFFYRYYYVNKYPNELSTVSIKKINMFQQNTVLHTNHQIAEIENNHDIQNL